MTVLGAPELAPYTGEPRQIPSGAPGKIGPLDMIFAVAVTGRYPRTWRADPGSRPWGPPPA